MSETIQSFSLSTNYLLGKSLQLVRCRVARIAGQAINLRRDEFFEGQHPKANLVVPTHEFYSWYLYFVVLQACIKRAGNVTRAGFDGWITQATIPGLHIYYPPIGNEYAAEITSGRTTANPL